MFSGLNLHKGLPAGSTKYKRLYYCIDKWSKQQDIHIPEATGNSETPKFNSRDASMLFRDSPDIHESGLQSSLMLSPDQHVPVGK